MKHLIIDAMQAIVLGFLFVFFFTNFFTDQWNIWALMVRFG